ncbi:MAG: hypothetical protein SNJ67_10865 [Chloracidobacterium sp.]
MACLRYDGLAQSGCRQRTLLALRETARHPSARRSPDKKTVDKVTLDAFAMIRIY